MVCLQRVDSEPPKRGDSSAAQCQFFSGVCRVRSLLCQDLVTRWTPASHFLTCRSVPIFLVFPCALKSELLAITQSISLCNSLCSQNSLRFTISLNTGDPVTLATHNDLLSVAHYSGTTLSLSLLDTKKPRQVYSGPLPLSPSSSLSWLGFTQGALPLVRC